jgi:hypothetical protein
MVRKELRILGVYDEGGRSAQGTSAAESPHMLSMRASIPLKCLTRGKIAFSAEFG